MTNTANSETVVMACERIVWAQEAQEVNGVLLRPDMAAQVLSVYSRLDMANQALFGRMTDTVAAVVLAARMVGRFGI